MTERSEKQTPGEHSPQHSIAMRLTEGAVAADPKGYADQVFDALIADMEKTFRKAGKDAEQSKTLSNREYHRGIQDALMGVLYVTTMARLNLHSKSKEHSSTTEVLTESA